MLALLIRLESPLMAFGREAIDQNGPTRAHPDASMLTGLLANALGYDRTEAERHQRLQDRMTFAVRLDRPGSELRDFQTAQLAKADTGWTTHGVPEGRRGGGGTYESPHIRYRHYLADASLVVSIALSDADEAPTVDEVADALRQPARPIFIGRKPCVPSAPLLIGVVEAPTLLASFDQAPLAQAASSFRFVLPEHEAEGLDRVEVVRLTGHRDWVAGIHSGQQRRAIVSIPAKVSP
ncbi:type I-E CRISPR-associated protein Cas5/CasD [Bosea sp. RAC05]|uniref:type I-E CRISPR-associated protein Cas5/CasD n=1 Tax=Bosea sp. RAC05 TaxID=1842539 RepID=UPI00083CB875|nr:type I-E CRISPR-associated protein Cas5/CasD [Bosea sp. RAC05]AOG03433.1 CRISPR-associated protein Cas5/CasD, subtype I-E [Bosea sp. RAC05]